MTILRHALAAARKARPAARRKNDEHAFQRALFEFLDIALPAKAIVVSIDHAGAASHVSRALRAKRGVLPGIPDTGLCG